MSLRSHGNLRPLATKAILTASQPRSLPVTLHPSTTQAFNYRQLGKSVVCKSIHRQCLYSTVVLAHGDVQQADTLPIIPCAEAANSQTIQPTALLPSKLDSFPKDENGRALVFGKHQTHKQFVNQRLKDKGPLSYDWRIPLFQLEQAAASPAKIRDLNSDTNTGYRIRRTYHGSYQQNARLAREVRRPATWSEANLYYYVATIVDSQKPQTDIPRSRRKNYLNGSSNKADIAKIFEELFYDDTIKTFLSSEACNVALRFFYMHGMISKARALFSRMESLQLNIPPNTFNVILRSAALNKDLHNFTYLLQRMLQRGFKPDDATWVSLLIAVNSKEVRAIIAQKMDERNLILSPGSRKAIAELMIPNELDIHLGSGHNPDTFIDRMDIRYGPQWVTTRAGNSLLYEMGKRGCRNELALLQQLKQRSFVPDEVTMNTLLRLCLQRSLDYDAIKVLGFFDCHFKMRPGNKAYETLLTLAWDNRLLNFARVVWRSACIDGHVNFYMRNRVFQSLLHHDLRELPPSDKAGSRVNPGLGQIFRKLAGSFVVGVRRPQTAELAELGRALWISEFDSRKSTVKRARLQVQSDLRIARSCRLKVPLHELLRTALDLDLKWKAEGFWKNDDRQRMLQEGIQVEVMHFWLTDPDSEPQASRMRA